MKTQLLCTFTTKEGLDDVVKEITNAYTIVFNKIYVLQNEENIDELICTYNVDLESTEVIKVKDKEILIYLICTGKLKGDDYKRLWNKKR